MQMTKMDTSTSSSKKAESQGLNEFVKDMLGQMENRFTGVGESIIGRLDKISSKMDSLEQNISDLMEEAGLDIPQKPGTVLDVQTKGSPRNQETTPSDVL